MLHNAAAVQSVQIVKLILLIYSEKYDTEGRDLCNKIKNSTVLCIYLKTKNLHYHLKNTLYE